MLRCGRGLFAVVFVFVFVFSVQFVVSVVLCCVRLH